MSLPPERALAEGRWVKLICGASNQDLATIEDLCGIYTLAGVHCIDVAADPAAVEAARRGIAWGSARRPAAAAAPWLMVSLNDGADPHFRKAWFDPRRCPPDCLRPCAGVCPATAIDDSGVLEARCYGCGRCRPICPHGLIDEREHSLAGEAVAPLLAALRPDAVELHTRPGRAEAFAGRLQQVVASGLPLRRLGVSCSGDGGAAAVAAELWQRFDQLRRHRFSPIWQLDGRPMSGDVGAGTAHAAVRLLVNLRPLAPPGPLQLAGGTNDRTLRLLRRRTGSAAAARSQSCGVAFGGRARALLQPFLQEAERRGAPLLEDEALWPRALKAARALVSPWLAP